MVRAIKASPILLAATTLLLITCARAKQTTLPTPDFVPGQEWSIKSSVPTTPKVIIGRLEKWRNKVCVHVSIIDIRLSKGPSGVGGVTQIEHIPFDKTALATSVDTLLATGVATPPNFENGYKQW